MNLRIQVQGFSLTAAIADRTRQRAESALSRFDEEIIAVDAFLKDVNGPKGGRDKIALLRILLRNRPPVVIESLGDDLYGAIDRSSRRARKAVERALVRNRQLMRDRARRSQGAARAASPGPEPAHPGNPSQAVRVPG